MGVLEQVKGVRLIVTPQDLPEAAGVAAPAVKVDDDLIAWDKGPGNGIVTEGALLDAVLKHGAVRVPEKE